ncbi:MAG: aldose 1-epimerase [Nitrososphaerota archaeon]
MPGNFCINFLISMGFSMTMVCRISTLWKYRDMRTLIIENSRIRLVILLDKGADIIELRYKPLDLDLMWHSPTGWRNPVMETSPNPNNMGGFLDYYGGGWQDIVPSAGGASVTHRGAALGIHGESSMLPWSCEILEDGVEEVSAHLWVEGVRYPFRLDKWIEVRRDEEKLYVRERLSNPSNQALEYSWLQHPSFGEPFLEPKCKIRIPTPAEVIVLEGEHLGRLQPGTYEWPTVTGKDGKPIDLSIIPSREIVAEETSFIANMREGWYILSNPKLDLGFGLAWDIGVYRYLWFWQNYNAPDYPWYGTAWNIALEPCTSYPGGLPAQIQRKTHITIPPKGHLETSLTAFVLSNPEKIGKLDVRGESE